MLFIIKFKTGCIHGIYDLCFCRMDDLCSHETSVLFESDDLSAIYTDGKLIKYNKKENHIFLIWSVALAGLSNFYFFYMLGIFMVLYAAVRYFEQFEDRSLKNIGRWLGTFFVYSIIAVLIAAVILLPVILPVLGTDPVLKAQNYVPLLYDKVYYEKISWMSDWRKHDPVGSCRIYCSFYDRCLCTVFKAKKIYSIESGICIAECFFASALCRTCVKWIFLCLKSMDLG